MTKGFVISHRHLGDLGIPLVAGADNPFADDNRPAPPFRTHRAFVFAWLQATTGGTQATLRPRLFRQQEFGAETFITEDNAENIKAAAGQTEPFVCMGVEEINNLAYAAYGVNWVSPAGSGAGTRRQQTILTLIL